LEGEPFFQTGAAEGVQAVEEGEGLEEDFCAYLGPLGTVQEVAWHRGEVEMEVEVEVDSQSSSVPFPGLSDLTFSYPPCSWLEAFVPSRVLEGWSSLDSYSSAVMRLHAKCCLPRTAASSVTPHLHIPIIFLAWKSTAGHGILLPMLCSKARSEGGDVVLYLSLAPCM
jgi:hypothetical protein